MKAQPKSKKGQDVKGSRKTKKQEIEVKKTEEDDEEAKEKRKQEEW